MNAPMAQRYLVTGCAGFIGAKVCELLLDDGHVVVGADNLVDSYDVRLKQWRLDRLKPRDNFCFQEIDINDRVQLETLWEVDVSDGAEDTGGPYAAIIHLAARAGVRESLRFPAEYLETNALGTLHLLEGCRDLGVEKFVLASSSSLYGGSKPPFDEETPTDHPPSPYAATKKSAELLAWTYHHLYRVDVSVLRYFTAYGPAARPDMCVFRFIRWVMEGEPVGLFGDGSQERDFTYIDDLARGTVAALKPLGYEIINLGSGRTVSLRELLVRISKLTGKPAKLAHEPSHPADIPATRAVISKAKKLLGWTPQVSLDEGLELAVQWYCDHRELAKTVEL